MRWKKNIIRTMNRLAVVRSSVGGGVAHSTASKIPWQKRNGAVIQSGGSTFKYGMRLGDMLTGRRKPQKGGFSQSMRKKQQKGGFWKTMERSMFGIKREKSRTRKVKQKGGVLGLDKFQRYYKGKSKKEQGQMDAWAAKNL